MHTWHALVDMLSYILLHLQTHFVVHVGFIGLLFFGDKFIGLVVSDIMFS